MDHQPSNMQVIIQGTNRDGNIFLADETGIIKSIKVVLTYVSGNSQADRRVCSALHDSDGDTRHMHSLLSEQISR